ncbi:MAG: hypothetical protein EAZ88_19020, partial [Oscillatoriales cyanobacterium]
QLKANFEYTKLVNDKIIQRILDEKRDVKPFVSFANVVERIQGLGDKTMIKIIDYWQNTHKL